MPSRLITPDTGKPLQSHSRPCSVTPFTTTLNTTHSIALHIMGNCINKTSVPAETVPQPLRSGSSLNPSASSESFRTASSGRRGRGQSGGSHPDLLIASASSIGPAPGENVWTVPAGCKVPEGFVDFPEHTAHLPVAFLPANPHVCFRVGEQEALAVAGAFDVLRGAALNENDVVWAFLDGKRAETFNALATLVENRLLDVCHDVGSATATSRRAGKTLLDEMARFGEEAGPGTAHPQGISLAARFDRLVQAGVSLLTPGGPDGRTPPLAAAIEEKNLAVVKALLDCGVNPSRFPGLEATPLMLAEESGCSEIVEALLERGADPNVRSVPSGEPDERLGPIHRAVQKRRNGLRELDLLLERGAQVNLQSGTHGLTAFHYAIFTHQFETAKKLIENGADPDVFDRNGNTALHIACNRNDAAAILMCIGLKGNVNLRNSAGQCPLYLAIRNFADRQTVAALIHAGADVNADNRVLQNMVSGGNTWRRVETRRPALHLLADYELRGEPVELDMDYLADIAALLVDHGADKEQRDLKSGDTPLHAAARRDNVPVMRVLLERGRQVARVLPRNYQGETPIEIAASRGNYSSCVYLQSKGGGYYRLRDPITSYGTGGGA